MLCFHENNNLITGDSEAFKAMEDELETFAAERELNYKTLKLLIYPGAEKDLVKKSLEIWAHIAFLNDIRAGNLVERGGEGRKNEFSELFTEWVGSTGSKFSSLAHRKAAEEFFTRTYEELTQKAIAHFYAYKKGESSLSIEEKIKALEESGNIVYEDTVLKRVPKTEKQANYIKMIDICMAEVAPMHYGLGEKGDKPPFSKLHPEVRLLPEKEQGHLLNSAAHMKKAETPLESNHQFRRMEKETLRALERVEHKRLRKEYGLDISFDDTIQREEGVAKAITENLNHNHGVILVNVTRLHVWGEELKKNLEERGIYEAKDDFAASPENTRSSDPAIEWRKRYIINLSEDFRVEIMPIYDRDEKVQFSFHRPVFQGEARNKAEHGKEVIIRGEWNLKASSARKETKNLLRGFVNDLIKADDDDVRDIFPLREFIEPVSPERATEENKGAMSYTYHAEDQKDENGDIKESSFPFNISDAMYSQPRQRNKDFKAVLREAVPQYNDYENYRR